MVEKTKNKETACHSLRGGVLCSGDTIIMKKEITEYIERLMTKERPLTVPQVRTVAYWELVAFTDERKG
jgi:hypothetical protein